MKKIFGIIGKPLKHSLSPTLHNYWFKKYKIDANYVLIETEEKEIKKTIEKIKNKEIQGLNITLPYKQKVIPFIEKLVNNAKETHSVNTLYLNKENNLIGDNTDVYGLQAGYLNKIVDINNQKALVIGAGGVSPSIIFALKKSKVKEISIVNRTHEKAVFLKKNFEFLQTIKWSDLKAEIKNFDIIINATSLGLKNGDDFDFFFDNLKEKAIYIDTIYNPLETKMIKDLKSKGIKTFNGLDMLIYQGQKSFYLWCQINPDIDDQLLELLKEKIR